MVQIIARFHFIQLWVLWIQSKFENSQTQAHIIMLNLFKIKLDDFEADR